MPPRLNLRRGQGVGLVDEVAERALQFQTVGGEGRGRASLCFQMVRERPKQGTRILGRGRM